MCACKYLCGEPCIQRARRGRPLWSATRDTVCTWELWRPSERLATSWMLSKSTKDRREMFPFRWTRTKCWPPGSTSQNSNGLDVWTLKRGRGPVSTVFVVQYRSSLACCTTDVRSSPVERAVRGKMWRATEAFLEHHFAASSSQTWCSSRFVLRYLHVCGGSSVLFFLDGGVGQPDKF